MGSHRRTKYTESAPVHLYNSLVPGPLFIFGFERAWYAKIRHVTSLGPAWRVPPFIMTSFQSSYGQVVYLAGASTRVVRLTVE